MSQAVHGGRIDLACRIHGGEARDWLDFSVNLNPYAPPLSTTIWRRIGAAAGCYGDPAARELRDRLGQCYAVSPSCLLPTAGGSEALYLAARLFAGKTVLVAEPGFGDYARAVTAADGMAIRHEIFHPHASGAPTAVLARLARAIADHRPACVLLGNPNNPTGHGIPARALGELIHAHDCAWIVDEAFSEFASVDPPHSLLPRLTGLPRLLIARSLTKSFAVPGLRIGFLATASRPWLERLADLQPPWSVSSLAQTWGEMVLAAEARMTLEKGLHRLARARARLFAGLDAIDGLRPYPSAVNFILVELLGGLSTGELSERLAARRILIRRCDSFHGLTPGRFFRLAVRRPTDNARLLAALRDCVP
ncbi:MAG: pyridoxal phosphate-dependent class II aminotransferase [Candidatus Competibacteraceae bacterium]|nr:pyridoxal phosphate-dependent class II aminotransferase [Candidatus Competibacteraceae bacterium]